MPATSTRALVAALALPFAVLSCSSSESAAPAGTGGSAGVANDGGVHPGNGPYGCPGATCDLSQSICLASADNAGKSRVDLRIGQLAVTAPKALTQPFVRDTVIGANLSLNVESCALYGKGQFSWLLSFDLANNTLTTGGAPIIADEAALKAGTCFLDTRDAKTGLDIKPATVSATVAADGSFGTTGAVDKVAIPIFLDQTGQNVVYLPLHQVVFDGLPSTGLLGDDGQPRRDGNCLGWYRSDSLAESENCLPADSNNGTVWQNGAHLVGYITVAEADTVWVKDSAESLCVLLSPDSSCKDDGATDPSRKGYCVQTPKCTTGDWDAASNTAGGAKDAYKLEANFAASGIAIKGVATQLDCSDAKPW